MLKKIVFTLMVVLAFSSLILAGYVYFEPEPEEIIYTTDYFTIEYDSLDSYLQSTGEAANHLLFFCAIGNNDCQYVENTLFTGVDKQDPSINTKEILEYVDLTEVEERDDFKKVKDKWNIPNYPAFVSCTMENGEPHINNMLVWQPNYSLSVTDIMSWFYSNNIGSAEGTLPTNN